jgi:hypothetical protein
MTEDLNTLFSDLAARYPKRSDSEIARYAVIDGLRALPAPFSFLGNATAFIFSTFFDPYEKRQEEWFKELADTVGYILTRVDSLEALQSNERFVSGVIQATRIASGTHRPEKRAMLRNALVNIAIGDAPDGDLQQIFLGLIDQLSISHVLVLNFIWTGFPKGDKAWERAATAFAAKNYGAAIQIQIPELRGQDDLIQFILNDLRNRGLSSLGSSNTLYPQGAVITNMGIRFLNFVLK